jgi:hypothetical protein
MIRGCLRERSQEGSRPGKVTPIRGVNGFFFRFFIGLFWKIKLQFLLACLFVCFFLISKKFFQGDFVLNFVFIEKISLGSHFVQLGEDFGVEGQIFVRQEQLVRVGFEI